MKKIHRIITFILIFAVTVLGAGLNTLPAFASVEDDIKNAIDNGDSYAVIVPVDPNKPILPGTIPKEIIDKLINEKLMFDVNVMVGDQKAYTYRFDGNKMNAETAASFDMGVTFEKIENGVIITLANKNGLPEGITLEVNRQGAIIVPADKVLEWWEQQNENWIGKGNIGKPDSVIRISDGEGVTKWKLTWSADTENDSDNGQDNNEENDSAGKTENDQQSNLPDSSPATGDDSNNMSNMVIMLVAAGVAVLAFVFRRRKV